MAKPKEYQSEEVAIPTAAFKKYFDNFNREKRLILLGLIASLILIAAAIATLIAIPMLIPSAFVPGVSSLWLGFEVVLAECTLFAFMIPAVAYFEFYEKQTSVQNKVANYKISKDNVEKTTFTNKKSLPKSLDKKIDQKLKMKDNIIKTVTDLIKNLQSDQKKIETQIALVNDDLLNNENNPKKLDLLAEKLKSLNVEKTNCEKHLADAKTSLTDLNLKYALTVEQKIMTTNEKISTNNLSIILDTNKALLATINKNKKILAILIKQEQESPLAKGAFKSQIDTLQQKIKTSREQLKTNISSHNEPIRATINQIQAVSLSSPEKKTIADPVIKEMQSDLGSILRPILLNVDQISLEDEDYAASLMSLCFEHIPKEATQHCARLLNENVSHQKNLNLINQIIDNDASLKNESKEALIFTLANHFFRKLSNGYQQENAEKACLYALKLDSNHSNNAEFKEEVIRTAFFFEHEIPNDFPNEAIQEILSNSHDRPNAYESIKTLIENNPSYKTPPSAVLSKPVAPVVAPASQAQKKSASQKLPKNK